MISEQEKEINNNKKAEQGAGLAVNNIIDEFATLKNKTITNCQYFYLYYLLNNTSKINKETNIKITCKKIIAYQYARLIFWGYLINYLLNHFFNNNNERLFNALNYFFNGKNFNLITFNNVDNNKQLFFIHQEEAKLFFVDFSLSYNLPSCDNQEQNYYYVPFIFDGNASWFLMTLQIVYCFLFIPSVIVYYYCFNINCRYNQLVLKNAFDYYNSNRALHGRRDIIFFKTDLLIKNLTIDIYNCHQYQIDAKEISYKAKLYYFWQKIIFHPYSSLLNYLFIKNNEDNEDEIDDFT